MKVRLTAVFCLIMILALSLPGGIQSMAFQPPAAPPSPGELTLSEADNGRQIELAESEMLVLELESNPSTGYGWEVQEMDRTILRQVEEVGVGFEPSSKSNLLGAPGTQILRFAGVSKGQTLLKLAYRRPWEKDVEPAKTFSVQVRSKGMFKGVHKPEPKPAVEDSLPADKQSILSVPSAYNWCDSGDCTPVKDQGSCGSCWAFSTVGPLESNIEILDGLTKDLSEQYLVSCNSDGWSCSGGWFAHDYHEWKYVSGESGPGAVYEADFPYTAQDDPCNPPHTHHETITDWAYVDNSYSVPSTSDLKQAIYDYGPVSVAVCVNSAFQSYSGDIFTGPSCSSVNHGVVLTGWDDSGGYWHLKNSWGTGWGENGYMRIAYGTSQVGYAANYIDYVPTRTADYGTTTIFDQVHGRTDKPAKAQVYIPKGLNIYTARLTGQGHNQDRVGYARVMEVKVNGNKYRVIPWISSGQTKSFDYTLPAGVLVNGWNDIEAYIHWSNPYYDNGHWVSVNLVLETKIVDVSGYGTTNVFNDERGNPANKA